MHRAQGRGYADGQEGQAGPTMALRPEPGAGQENCLFFYQVSLRLASLDPTQILESD